MLNYSIIAPNEECVQLTDPSNGRVTINGTEIGAVVSYECDVGYNLVGVQTRTCNSVGLWTSREPVCQGTADSLLLL